MGKACKKACSDEVSLSKVIREADPEAGPSPARNLGFRVSARGLGFRGT